MMKMLSLFLWTTIHVSVPVTTQGFIAPQNAAAGRMLPRATTLPLRSAATTATTTQPPPPEQVVDVIVVGAGIGGLSCAGLTAQYGLETVCLEAHDTAGGVAHSFTRPFVSPFSSGPEEKQQRQFFTFDSGPSLISGLSSKGTNPLRQVLDALGVADTMEWITYDGWMVHDYSDAKKGPLRVTTGDSGAWEDAIEHKAGKASREAFLQFRDTILAEDGLAKISTYIPPFALRGDLSAARSLSSYWLQFLRIGTQGALLTGPFSNIMKKEGLTDQFNRKWFDYLAFALSGLDAAHTQAAAVAYMMMDLHKPGAVLDYPKGGMDALIQALVTGVETHGGQVRLNSRVDKFLLDERNGQAHCGGVILGDGTVIRARKAVVCNAPLWNMARLLGESVADNKSAKVRESVAAIQSQAKEMEMTGSFMHLHLGIPKDGLPDDLDCHHSVLNFDKEITAEQNMVIMSIPTVFDPELAPDGYHVVHAYTAACDNYEDWESYTDNDEESSGRSTTRYSGDGGYRKLKDDKAEVLWKAVECVIPDVRERAAQKGSVCIVGSPLTHRRYNRRYRGTYGPAPSEGEDVWSLPGCKTRIHGLLACGDTTFPGIGLPGVAASGTIAANTIVPVKEQKRLIDKLQQMGALQ